MEARMPDGELRRASALTIGEIPWRICRAMREENEDRRLCATDALMSSFQALAAQSFALEMGRQYSLLFR